MLKRLWLPLITGFSAPIAGLAAKYLMDQPRLSVLWAFVAAGCVGAVCAAIISDVAAYAVKNSARIRSWVDPRAKYEGIWISTLVSRKERPYGYGVIEYSGATDSYTYRGAAFDEAGNIQSTWVASQVEIDVAERLMRFVTETQMMDKRSEFARAYGWIDFSGTALASDSTPVQGRGHFRAFADHGSAADFTIDRIKSKTVQELIQKREVITNRDIGELIRAYHAFKNPPIVPVAALPGRPPC